jgi:hypothetical protein
MASRMEIWFPRPTPMARSRPTKRLAVISAYDTTYASSGSPGIGFNYVYNSYCPGGTGQNDRYGFSSISATENAII